MPKNKTELGMLTFDPGQSSQNIWRDFDLQNLVFHPLSQIDPSMQQNIISALNGQQLGPNT